MQRWILILVLIGLAVPCQAQLPAPSISPADESRDAKRLVAADVELLDFSSRFCEPCQEMAPVIEQLIAAGYPVRKIDVQDQRATAEKYNVTSIPCFVLLDGGRVTKIIVGMADYEQLAAMFPGKRPARAAESDSPAPMEKSISPIVRVRVPDAKPRRDGGVGSSLGSGVVIDVNGKGQALVITNHHVIRDGAGHCTVEIGGKAVAGSVVKTDAAADLAAIVIEDPKNVTPPLLAAAPPAIGEKLTINGFGSDGKFRAAAGKLQRFVSELPAGEQVDLGEAGATTDFLDINVSARRGDSGGPILNEHGEVVGLLNASGPDVGTVGICSTRIQIQLLNWFPGIRCCGRGRAAQPTAPTPSPVVAGPYVPAYDFESKFGAVQKRLDTLESNLAGKLQNLPVQLPIDLKPIGTQIADVQQKLGGLDGLHQKADALIANAAAAKQKLDDFNSTAIGQTVKTAVDGAVAPLVQKLAAPIAAELGLPAMVGLGAAGGIPGVIAAALAAFALKKKSLTNNTSSDSQPPPSGSDPIGKVMAEIQKMKGAIDGFGKQSAAPPQVKTETNYVPVAVETPELTGIKMAMDELVRRDPGAWPWVESIKSFSKQYTSGLGGTSSLASA